MSQSRFIIIIFFIHNGYYVGRIRHWHNGNGSRKVNPWDVEHGRKILLHLSPVLLYRRLHPYPRPASVLEAKWIHPWDNTPAVYYRPVCMFPSYTSGRDSPNLWNRFETLPTVQQHSGLTYKDHWHTFDRHRTWYRREGSHKRMLR